MLSELQKAAKEGGDDELAVLRRERKRRLEAAQRLPRGGRDDLAAGEEAEGELIGGYLPAELSDAELCGDRRAGRADERRADAKGHGAGDEAGDGRRRWPCRRQARLGTRASVAAGMRTQVELPDEVAVELAGSQDAVLRALEAHLDCKVYLRGNVLTFDGEESETHRRRARRSRALGV